MCRPGRVGLDPNCSGVRRQLCIRAGGTTGYYPKGTGADGRECWSPGVDGSLSSQVGMGGWVRRRREDMGVVDGRE